MQRLATVKPNLPKDKLKQEAKQAMRKLEFIRRLPKLARIATMSLQELVSTLRECPESPMFTQSNIFMAENQARRLVTQFVDRALFASEMHVNEAESSQEASITTPRFSEEAD